MRSFRGATPSSPKSANRPLPTNVGDAKPVLQLPSPEGAVDERPPPAVKSNKKVAAMEDVAADLMPVATAQELVNCETLRASALSTLRWDAPDPKVADLFRLEALVRFIRARSANDQTMRLLASTRMLCDAVRWRMAFDVANVVAQHAKDTSPEAERLRRCWPMGIAGKDARGVPVYHARCGTADLEGDGARRWV